MTDRLYTLPQVSELLQVSVPTLRTWHRQKKIRTIKLPGGAIRMPATEVERLMGTPSSGGETDG